jgi:hypothetical protein
MGMLAVIAVFVIGFPLVYFVARLMDQYIDWFAQEFERLFDK